LVARRTSRTFTPIWAKVHVPRLANSSMPASRASKRAEKREHILACAQRIFATRGVVDATMQDIAHAAGVSKGALYLLFASKDELYLQLATAAAKGLVAHLQEATCLSTGFEQARALMKGYATFHLMDATLFRLATAWLAPGFYLDESLSMAVDYRNVVVEAMRISVAAFELGQRDGSIRADLDAPRTVVQLWGSVVGLLLVGVKAGDAGPLPPQVNGMLWRALGTNEAHPANIEMGHIVDEFIELVMSAVKAPSAATAKH
jgi:AcrR family transcriptional regulator